MLTINYKQVYETHESGEKEWVLIIYDISANHYVGIPVYSKEQKGSLFLNSINKYVLPSKIKDYNRSKMVKCIYIHNKPLKVSRKDFNKLMDECKNELSLYFKNEVETNIDNIAYLKWCRDKHILNQQNTADIELKQGGIYWVNMGHNVGSELRKLRPAILWRSTSDKKTWTMIPLTTKKRDDNRYFHYNLECLAEGSTKIENMMNFSYKRILCPYFSKNKLAIISTKDYKEIKKAISKYYLWK